MYFYIVDDEKAVRSMLSQIIEEADLGEVVGEEVYVPRREGGWAPGVFG